MMLDSCIDANAALNTLTTRRLVGHETALVWHGTTTWSGIISSARTDPVLRGLILGLQPSPVYDPKVFTRPTSLAEILPSQLDGRFQNAGANAETFALASADCTQANYLQTIGVQTALYAAFTEDPIVIARCVGMLRAANQWVPLQRPGWTLYDPNLQMPAGGDGVWLATNWGINGIVDMMSILGDRIPIDLRQSLQQQLRREVQTICKDWKDRRPWYVQGRAVRSNQWIEPNVGLVKACLFLEGAELLAAYNLGVENLAETLCNFGSDGAFPEGVSYAQMTLGMMFDVIEAVRLAGDTRLNNSQFVQSSWNWWAQMVMPGRRLVNCSDSGLGSLPSWAITTPLSGMVAAGLASTDARALPTLKTLFPRGNTSVMGVRYQAAISNLEAMQLSDMPTFGHFPSQQLVTWRTAVEVPNGTQSAWAIWMKGGSLTEGHVHRDQGQVSVYDGDIPVLIECGTPNYAEPNLNSTFANAAGHGIMQFGERQPRGIPVDAPLTVERLDRDGGQVLIDCTAAYISCSSCTRRVSWGSDRSVTIDDAVDFHVSVPAGTEIYRFHTGSPTPVEISQVTTGWLVRWGGYEMSIQSTVPVTVEQATWPDRVCEPSIHQALKIRTVNPTTAMSLTTCLRPRIVATN
jgi:hypothetical protein